VNTSFKKRDPTKRLNADVTCVLWVILKKMKISKPSSRDRRLRIL